MPTEWLLLLVGVACLVGLAGLLTFRRFDPRLARCVEPTATGYRARLNGWDRLAHILLAAGVYLPLVYVAAGAQMCVGVLLDTMIAWLGLAWGLSLWQPFARFLTDDVENGTLSWPGGSVRRDAVTGMEVVDRTVQILIPEPRTVARFRRPADTEALAEWLRERLNVGAESA